MKTVGFDTSTDETVVAAADGGSTLFERIVPPGDRRPLHSQVLLGLVDEAADRLGGWQSVERIAVGIGPGTFTGIRIGVATAGGLSASTGVPATGVSTLKALALSISESARNSGNVLPLLDAKRGEVFGCLHGPDGTPLGEAFACIPEELSSKLAEHIGDPSALLVAGPGAIRFRDELLRAGLVVEPDGSPVHRLAGRPFCDLGAAAEAVGPETLKPLYLRKPDAQLWLERDKNADQASKRTGR